MQFLSTLPAVNILMLLIAHFVVNLPTDGQVSPLPPSGKDLIDSSVTTIDYSASLLVLVGENQSEYISVTSEYPIVKPENKNVTPKTKLTENYQTTSTDLISSNVDTYTEEKTEHLMWNSSFLETFTRNVPSDSKESFSTQSPMKNETTQETSSANSSLEDASDSGNIPRIALLPINIEEEEDRKSRYFYFQIILIVFCSIAVVSLSAYLTKQLASENFTGRITRRTFFSRNRRSTIGKRYSDISLQMMNNEAALINLPDEFDEGTSPVFAHNSKTEIPPLFPDGVGKETPRFVAPRAEILNGTAHQSDSSERLKPWTQETVSPSSSGEWL